MKIMVTGVKGQLGYECVKELNRRGFYDVLGVDINDLDITDVNQTHKFIFENKPDVIIHCAGYTAVDKTEIYKSTAYFVNAEGARNIAEAAKAIDAKMVYISTDYVFAGKGTSFQSIDEEKDPLNYYGYTKLQGEELSKKNCDRLFIVRTSWVFGINGNNFVNTMLNLSGLYETLDVVSDQIGSPTYAHDLAVFICNLIVTDKYGVYHATNEGICSWAEFAEEIFKQTHKNVKVNYVTTKEYLKKKPQQAIRPLNSRLSKKCLDDAGFKRLPEWKDALSRYLKELKII